MSESSPAIAACVGKYARPILCNWVCSHKTARLHGFGHPGVKAALDELERNVEGFISVAGECRISRAGNRLFFNSLEVKLDAGSQPTSQLIVQLLNERAIGQVALRKGVDREQIESLVKLLARAAPPAESAWSSFEASAAEVRMPSIRFVRSGESAADAPADIDHRWLVKGIYFKAIACMDVVLREAKAGSPMSLKRLKQAAHELVDGVRDDRDLLLALVPIKGQGEPGSNHAVNVAVLSIALGARLGLSKKLLGDLGLAALLHDIGKAQLPDRLRATSQGDVRIEHRSAYAAHVIEGVKALLRERATESILRSLNVAFFHHYRHDRAGYPKLVSPRTQSLFTRIVAVADAYDNLTTPREGTRDAAEPEVACRTLLNVAGSELDPLIVKAFIHLLGLFPPGCVVRLDTGEVGTVLAPSSNPQLLDRPLVRVFLDAAGDPTDATLNLLDRDENGRFRRTILKTYRQHDVRLELAEYLSVI
jgi:HD-GYP domain-containing protein (c-di-GMP phosphodiesterase class II)